MKIHHKNILVIIMCLSLGACVSLLPKGDPAAPRYTMRAITPVVNQTINARLAIADPSAGQLYKGVKVAISREPNRFEFYTGAEWADRSPRLFQKVLVQSFENSNRIINVGDFVQMPIADYVLGTDVRAFYVDDVSNPSAALVTIYVRLKNQKGEVIGVREFSQRERVNNDNISQVMEGFDRAVEKTLREIVSWTVETLPPETKVSDVEEVTIDVNSP